MRKTLIASGAAWAMYDLTAVASPTLTLDQMQRELNVHFMPSIRQGIGAPEPQAAFELTPGGYF